MTRILLSAALLALVAAPAVRADDKADPPKGDLAKFQGEWTGKIGPNRTVPMTVTFEGSAVKVHVSTPNNGDVELKGEVKLDETAKPHKTIDWVKFTRPNGEDAPPNLGLYTLKGDTLTVCNGGPGNERPTEFAQGEGGPPNVIVFTRKAVGK